MKTRCPSVDAPCYTLQEYASQKNTCFTSNTTFYFLSGLHKLEVSLRMINIYNLYFQGVPNDNEMVKIAFNSSASIIWENCSDIGIFSISILLPDNFNFSIVFDCTHSIHIFNISILGNGNSGCSSILSRKSVLNITNSKFIGIQGYFGAALMITASSEVTFTGSNIFNGNSAQRGGAIYLNNSVLTMHASGATFFTNNSITRTLYVWKETVGTVSRYYGIGIGGAIYSNNSILTLKGQSKVTFSKNKAVPVNWHTPSKGAGGAIAVVNGSFTLQGFISFYNNNASFQGGAILLRDVISRFCGAITFDKNTAEFGGALHMESTNISFNVDHTVNDSVIIIFQNNIAFYRGGAIESHNSNLTFTKTVHFEANSANYGDGGAMSLLDSSKLILVPSLHISFLKNHANNTGGALYIEDFQCLLGSLAPVECFISIQSFHASTRDISLQFEHNSAGSTGSILYGGLLNKCRLHYRTNYTIDRCGNRACNDYSDDALGLFMNISGIAESESATNISSQAEQLKFCQDEKNRMHVGTSHFISIHPGQQFNISVIALGQTGSPVTTVIFYENTNAPGQYSLSPSSQSITDTCCNLSFHLYSAVSDIYGQFKLYPQTPCQSLVDGLNLDIFIEPCPLGFELSDNQQCYCNKRLLKFTQKCSIVSISKSIARIKRMKNNFWISQKGFGILLIHDFRCPLDYCKDTPEDVSLSDPSVQCDFNRTGIVCGNCRKNFSLAFGSLHCIPCDNKYSALILFFTMAGVAIIAVIFLLRLTVSVGTLNGLFFYANIVQANNQAFFPRATINFLTVFISWLNLDLGIETCFYDGMDIYAYSWFQFLFPFYLLFLVGIIILICRYSQLIAKRLGQNPVAVLATVLLMSYSKILSAVIVPLTWTYLTYYTASNETQSVVWMYDASIDFFGEPKHTALGLFAITSLVVFVLPYIFLLFFGHWLQRYSNWWILSWLNKLKPFMDAYHAPYKKHTRYWTGLLLISRLGLFLIFANDSESVNIAVVTSISFGLLAIRFRVYEHFYNDILESSFILNLGIFSLATFYCKEISDSESNSQLILSSISIGIAFITFIGILIFHVSLVLRSSNIWKVHMLPLIQKSLLLSKILRITPVTKDKNTTGDKDAAELQALPTSTEIDVDLREPLLEISETQAAA